MRTSRTVALWMCAGFAFQFQLLTSGEGSEADFASTDSLQAVSNMQKQRGRDTLLQTHVHVDKGWVGRRGKAYVCFMIEQPPAFTATLQKERGDVKARMGRRGSSSQTSGQVGPADVIDFLKRLNK